MGGYLSRDTGESDELKNKLAELEKELEKAKEEATAKADEFKKLQQEAEDSTTKNDTLSKEKTELEEKLSSVQKDKEASEAEFKGKLVSASFICVFSQ